MKETPNEPAESGGFLLIWLWNRALSIDNFHAQLQRRIALKLR
jgi:hypothetical protein